MLLWEKRHYHKPRWETAPYLDVLSLKPTVQVVDTWYLCRTGLQNGLYPRGLEPPFHKTRAQSTGFLRLPVQDVGKPGREITRPAGFSIHPDLHSQVLENKAGTQPLLHEGVHLLFHFSCANYGGYCLCFYLIRFFLKNRHVATGV